MFEIIIGGDASGLTYHDFEVAKHTAREVHGTTGDPVEIQDTQGTLYFSLGVDK